MAISGLERSTNRLMGITSLLDDARSNHYAVGAFNYTNAETACAIIGTAALLRSPVILIPGPWEIPLIGAEMIVEIAQSVAARVDVPVCMHLDHAKDLSLVRECIDAGFPSVMIDASEHDFEENIRLTRAVVEMAHPLGVTVEGELGAVGRVGQSPEGTDMPALTDPDEAAEFVERTGVDALAVAIGNSHGIYPQRPELDFELLEAIGAATSVPLVLHGGSGTHPDQLQRAIDLGITKVNVASDISKAYLDAIRSAVDHNAGVWYASALLDARSATERVVERWMRQLDSVSRANGSRVLL